MQDGLGSEMAMLFGDVFGGLSINLYLAAVTLSARPVCSRVKCTPKMIAVIPVMHHRNDFHCEKIAP